MGGMNGITRMLHRQRMIMMMMHMTFSWGTSSEILFTGWLGRRIAMYAVALLFVFALCEPIEWLSHCHLLLAKHGVTTGILRPLLHAVLMGLAYLAMLALMSFNAGVFLAMVMGHAVGFLLFASGVFGKPEYAEKATSDLPPNELPMMIVMSCGVVASDNMTAEFPV